jgi:hypothetical protein
MILASEGTGIDWLDMHSPSEPSGLSRRATHLVLLGAGLLSLVVAAAFGWSRHYNADTLALLPMVILPFAPLHLAVSKKRQGNASLAGVGAVCALLGIVEFAQDAGAQRGWELFVVPLVQLVATVPTAIAVAIARAVRSD